MRSNSSLALFLFAGLLVGLCVVPGCSPAEFATVGSDDGHVVLTAEQEARGASLPASKLLKVRLPSLPQTGYVWQIVEADDSVLAPLDEVNEFSKAEGGGSANHVIRFVPKATGRTRIKLVYRRPWEKDVAPARTFSAEVDVKGTYTGKEPAPLATAKPATTQEQAVNLVGASLPSRYNFCETYGCTPIKDQGQCGGCWAFATNGVVEQLIRQKDKVSRDLSEQFLISCNTDDWGCDTGGYQAFDYYVNKKASGQSSAGTVYEADYPYKATDSSCKGSVTHHEKLKSYTAIGSTATADLKNAIINHGPIWVGICADYSFSYYTGGVFSGSLFCWSLNHGVVIVGWDDANGAWIMRNSYGSSWGEKGYMRIKYGANSIASADNYYATYAPSCTPTTCAAQGKNCGSISNGCGGTLDCGSCANGQTCSNNVCTTGTCTPTTCAAQGKNCGSISDGCGGTLNCGSCASGQTCSSNVCTTSTCTPTTCAAKQKNCGSISDGCGGTLNCGSCPVHTTCGGGGTANVCGQACGETYARSNCYSYAKGDIVSYNGRNYMCENSNCYRCYWYSSCAPGDGNCSYGDNWDDIGVCQ